MKKIHLVVVEDDVICREALIRRLIDYKDILVVAHAGNGKDALNLIQKRKPDVLLLDYRMERGPGPDGLVLIRKVREVSLSLKIITLTGLHNPYALSLALKCGANSIVLKDEAFKGEYLVNVIHKAYKGNYCLPKIHNLSHSIYSANEERNHFEHRLNNTQLQAIALLSKGKNYKEIAMELGKKNPGSIGNALQKAREIQNVNINQDLVNMYRKLFPK